VLGFANDGKIPMETVLLLLTNGYGGKEKHTFHLLAQ
jgi:hypothetical protein